MQQKRNAFKKKKIVLQNQRKLKKVCGKKRKTLMPLIHIIHEQGYKNAKVQSVVFPGAVKSMLDDVNDEQLGISWCR